MTGKGKNNYSTGAPTENSFMQGAECFQKQTLQTRPPGPRNLSAKMALPTKVQDAHKES